MIAKCSTVVPGQWDSLQLDNTFVTVGGVVTVNSKGLYRKIAIV